VAGADAAHHAAGAAAPRTILPPRPGGPACPGAQRKSPLEQARGGKCERSGDDWEARPCATFLEAALR